MGTLVAATLGFADPAHAEAERGSATAKAVPATDAGVTIEQAIVAAERRTGDRAVGTGIENGTATFYVEVLKDGIQHRVIVDRRSGRVVNAATGSSGSI